MWKLPQRRGNCHDDDEAGGDEAGGDEAVTRMMMNEAGDELKLVMEKYEGRMEKSGK